MAKKGARKERPERSGSARPIWSGMITFGLVSVPVDLFPANRARAVSLRMLDADGTPLRREYVCPEHGEPVTSDEIVRGYETESGEVVVVTDEELEALQPKRSREIDLVQFVQAEELPELYFERAYSLVPSGESTKAYRLLASTMEESGRVGIGTFVLRGKQHLVAIIAENGILRAETLRYADEVRSPESIGLDDLPRPPAAEVKRLRKLIKAHTEKSIDVDELTDGWVEQIRALAEKKRQRGEDVVEVDVEASPSESARVVDLMAVLKQQLGVKGDGEGSKPKPARAKRTRPALDAESKEALYDRAKALDIPGRSKMTKEELIDALERAS